MRITRSMKKGICFILLGLILLVVSACAGEEDIFTATEGGKIVDNSGTEYEFLANEGVLYYLGEPVFQGGVKGEAKTFQHLDLSIRTGMYSIKNAETDNILIRRVPNNEWYSIYRKSSLPLFDHSADSCVRLELVLGSGNAEADAIHATCGDGITDRTVIAEFLSDIRTQEDPREAGAYDLVTKSDGTLENCYIYAVIYGFFEEETNLAIRMDITSYNDLAYSISIDGKEYMLPETWIQRLQNN